MITAEKNRLSSAPTSQKKDIMNHIKWLKNSLKKIDAALAKKVQTNPSWKEKDDIYQTGFHFVPFLAIELRIVSSLCIQAV